MPWSLSGGGWPAPSAKVGDVEILRRVTAGRVAVGPVTISPLSMSSSLPPLSSDTRWPSLPRFRFPLMDVLRLCVGGSGRGWGAGGQREGGVGGRERGGKERVWLGGWLQVGRD